MSRDYSTPPKFDEIIKTKEINERYFNNKSVDYERYVSDMIIQEGICKDEDDLNRYIDNLNILGDQITGGIVPQSNKM